MCQDHPQQDKRHRATPGMEPTCSSSRFTKHSPSKIIIKKIICILISMKATSKPFDFLEAYMHLGLAKQMSKILRGQMALRSLNPTHKGSRARQDIPQAGTYHAPCMDGCLRSPRPKSKCRSVCNTCRTISATAKSCNQKNFGLSKF